jgi:tetratricopeptide (TPR) repeat protein
MAEQIDDSHALVIARRGMADAHRASGRYAEAQDHYRAATSLAREISDPYEEAKGLEGIAETTLHIQGPEAARIRLLQALDIFEQIGVPEAEAVRIRIEAMDFAHGRRVS